MMRTIDYFQHECVDNGYDDEFFDDIQYHMKEEFFDKGTEIITIGENCNSIMFIVNGEVELQITDQYGDKMVLESLGQGSHIG